MDSLGGVLDKGPLYEIYVKEIVFGEISPEKKKKSQKIPKLKQLVHI